MQIIPKAIHSMRRALPHLRDRQGVALPVALVGLVAVSLLVTTALVTSSTELALSNAHQDGTRLLYVAENGLEAHVSAFAADSQYLSVGSADQMVSGTSDQVRITVARMDSSLFANGDSIQQTYSVLAEPLVADEPRGRAVLALIRQASMQTDSLNVDITSALAVAGDLQIQGNAFEVNGRLAAGDTCASVGGGGVEALKKAQDSEISFSGQERWNRFTGTNDSGQDTQGTAAVETSTLAQAAFVQDILNGMTIDELANSISPTLKRFRTTSPAYSSAWLASVLNQTSGAGVAVVDAQGGTITVGPGTYHGLMIVVNGDIDLQGAVNFNGIVLVEENFNIGGSATVRGAVISLAMNGENVVEEDDSGIGNGAVRVQYDRCMIKQAKENFADNDQRPFIARTERSFGWTEVIR